MIVNGRQLRDQILKKIVVRSALSLGIIYIGKNPTSEAFISQKQKIAQKSGIKV